MSRTTENPNYKKVNRTAMARSNFRGKACQQWIRKNAPEIWQLIDEEAFRLWPRLKPGTPVSTNVSDFIEKLGGKP